MERKSIIFQRSITVVFGAGGFLGRAICKQIDSHELLPLYRRALDVTDTDEMLRYLNTTRPAFVINAVVTPDFSNPGIDKLRPVNVEAPSIMAQWCAENGATMVQVSAAIVHGLRFVEAGAGAPIVLDNDYGRSKFEADEAIAATGCRHAIVRFGGIYGHPGPTHLWLNKAIASAANGIPPIVCGQGSARRNYIHVDDAASAILHLMHSGFNGIAYAGGSEVLTIAEMAGAVATRFGLRPMHATGDEAADSIVVRSDLPETRPMADVLRSVEQLPLANRQVG